MLDARGKLSGEDGPVFLCENGPDGAPVLFDGAVQLIVAYAADEVAPALSRLDAARASGAWVAGYITYEAGYALEPKLAGLMPDMGGEPLLLFGVFDAPQDAGAMLAGLGRDAALAPLEPQISRMAYDAAMAKVAGYIAAGDCYQINLTFPITTRLLSGDALGLYGALRARQKVAHGAFCDFGVGPVIVSRSPGLFFECDGLGGIAAQPMKGTRPRDSDPVRDAELAADLFGSVKDRAENLMIVDLLRNDIARISEVGSVRVPELYAVESFATVHQMSSRVVGRLSGRPGMAGLMTALFPCGSITGAPKIRAMEIIAEVEAGPRGVYCGAMGWMAPDGRAAFNVAIRTLRLYSDGRVLLNVGGGVVYDSTTAGEWEEALWKARYAEALVRRG